MLTGHGGSRVHIQRGTAVDGVACIKAIRAGTGYGLKQAKDAWDLSETKVAILETQNTDDQRQMSRDLCELGIRVM